MGPVQELRAAARGIRVKAVPWLAEVPASDGSCGLCPGRQ